MEKEILAATGATSIVDKQLIQKLWNDYGDLLKVELSGGKYPSVILKHIVIPEDQLHPRGWATDRSKQRKIKSYRVETNWYENYNQINLKDNTSPTAKCLASFQRDGEFFILLEDLDSLGFEKRLTSVELDEVKLVLSWLASFHAKFLNNSGKGLWQTGTYWHLETRPDELEALKDLPLKRASSLIDQRLKNSVFQTIVHGDAKLANFCFSHDSKKVAAVDFQYVGKGCGMKDVDYFIGSCLDEAACQKYEEELLEFYFEKLEFSLSISTTQFKQLKNEWRELYPFAWADFHRFLKGWSPGHWKINTYSEKTCHKVINVLNDELSTMARTACLEAGKIIMSYWKRDFQISDKGGSSPSTSIVTEVDRKAQDKIISILAPSLERYDLGLLAEESDDNKTRFEKEFFWAIDPLDGTLYFSDGKSGFAVSIAFVDKGGMPVLGVVYDPVSKRVFHAIKDQGTFCNGERIYTSPDKVEKTIFFADRSIKNSPNYSELKEKFDIRFSGGSVMNAINVLTHPNAFYLKYPKQETGGCAVWDLAATSLILEEAGGSMTGHNGEKLNFNPNDSVFFNKTGLLCSHHKFPQTFP